MSMMVSNLVLKDFKMSRASFREKVEQAYTKIQTELSNNYTVINFIDVRSM